MFFFKASTEACQGVATIIDRFCAISGQLLNLQKSFVKFSPNIPTTTQQQYKEILCMESVTSLGNYLGIPVDMYGNIPVDIKDNKIKHFTPLLDRITSKISQWSHMDMSQPAKVIIINSVLIGAIRHYLSVFRIPTTIVNKIDSIMASFFWKDRFGKGIHWKSREILHCPRFSGGLGIRNVGLFNQALLMKKVWRITQNPQLLLSRVYQTSRISYGLQIFRRRRLSWGHRSLLYAETLFNDNCRWKVGNGQHLGIVSHKWLPDHQPMFKDTTPLATVRHLKVQHLLLPDNQGWNIRKINSLFEQTTTRCIKGLELPHCSTVSDIQIWPFTYSDTYTTKSGYQVLLQQIKK